jgi:hypothetical protein
MVNNFSYDSKLNVINITMVIYCHSTIITKLMLLYNTELWYDHGLAVNYRGKKFYNIGCWWQKLAADRSYFPPSVPELTNLADCVEEAECWLGTDEFWKTVG